MSELLVLNIKTNWKGRIAFIILIFIEFFHGEPAILIYIQLKFLWTVDSSSRALVISFLNRSHSFAVLKSRLLTYGSLYSSLPSFEKRKNTMQIRKSEHERIWYFLEQLSALCLKWFMKMWTLRRPRQPDHYRFKASLWT